MGGYKVGMRGGGGVGHSQTLKQRGTVIEIQHMKFQESAVSKAILSTVYSLQSTEG